MCRARAEAGAPAGLAVQAGRQGAGRGSRGQLWVSPPGNLYLSALLRPRWPAAQAGQWSLIAGVALAEAVAAAVPDAALTLKWPNDLLLDDAKLAGVLIDSAASTSGTLDWLVIGIGVNLASAPNLPDRRTACLGATGPSPERLARSILSHLDLWHARVAVEGFTPVRTAWLNWADPATRDIGLDESGAPRKLAMEA